MASVIKCEGTIETDSGGAPLCLDEMLDPVAWSVLDWSPVEVDPVTAAQAFGAGFLIMASWWVAIAGIVVVVRFLRSV